MHAPGFDQGTAGSDHGSCARGAIAPRLLDCTRGDEHRGTGAAGQETSRGDCGRSRGTARGNDTVDSCVRRNDGGGHGFLRAQE